MLDCCFESALIKTLNIHLQDATLTDRIEQEGRRLM